MRRNRLVLSVLAGSVLGGSALWVAADRWIGSRFKSLRPDLEAQISQPLGHPVSLGRYRGLGPLGVAFGPVQVRRGPRDQSSAAIQRISIGVNPLLSLQRLRPVLTVRVRGVHLDLRRNDQGAYWVPGPLPKQGDPPKLDLQIRLSDPARIRIAPAGLSLTADGWSGIRLDEHRADASVQLALPDRGRISVKGRGRWVQPEFQLTTKLERLQLSRYQNLLPMAHLLRCRVSSVAICVWDGVRDAPAAAVACRCRGPDSPVIHCSMSWRRPSCESVVAVMCSGSRRVDGPTALTQPRLEAACASIVPSH